MALNEQQARPTYDELESFIRLVHRGFEAGRVRGGVIIDVSPEAMERDSMPMVSLHQMSAALVERLALPTAAMASSEDLRPTEADRKILDGPTLNWVAGRCDDVARFPKIPLSMQTAASELGVFFRSCIGVEQAAAR